MSDGTDLAMGNALAGGAIAVATLEALFRKGVFSLEEGRAILDSAMRSLAPVMQQPGAPQAAQIIGSLMRGQFTTRG
jgi:hypothetical protein